MKVDQNGVVQGSKPYKLLKYNVYNRKTKFGYQASVLLEGVFVEVRDKKGAQPRTEGWFQVYASEGFANWISKKNQKRYIYANGDVMWVPVSNADTDLTVY